MIRNCAALGDKSTRFLPPRIDRWYPPAGPHRAYYRFFGAVFLLALFFSPVLRNIISRRIPGKVKKKIQQAPRNRIYAGPDGGRSWIRIEPCASHLA